MFYGPVMTDTSWVKGLRAMSDATGKGVPLRPVKKANEPAVSRADEEDKEILKQTLPKMSMLRDEF